MDSRRGRRAMWAQVVVAFLVGAILSQPAAAGTREPTLPVVEVEAEGEVWAKPDMAVMLFTIETQAAAAQEAVAANAERSEAFLSRMKQLLAPAEKVQSTSYRVYPLYRPKEKMQGPATGRTPAITGYRVHHSFRVELQDMGKIGKVSDAAITQGVTGVQGPFWDHSRKDELQQQAAAAALRRARELAAALAQVEGLTIKRLLRISTVHALRPWLGGINRMAPAAAAPETPIEVGEEKLQAKVKVIFELGP